MTEIEPFKSRREREVEVKRDAMAARLHELGDLVAKGEITGFALVTVDAAGRRPTTEWNGVCGADALGHGIGLLSFRFFRAHGGQS